MVIFTLKRRRPRETYNTCTLRALLALFRSERVRIPVSYRKQPLRENLEYLQSPSLFQQNGISTSRSPHLIQASIDTTHETKMAPKPQDRIGHICRMQKDSTSSINDPILTDNMLLVLAPAGEDAAYMWVAPVSSLPPLLPLSSPSTPHN